MTSLPLYDRLSIRLSADGFSFCFMCRPDNVGETSSIVYDSLQTEPNISLAANIKQLLERRADLPYQGLNFRRIDILMDVVGKYTTMPLELFEDEQTDVIFHQMHQERPGETVLYNVLDRSNVVVLFAMDKSACLLLQEIFPQCKIWANVSPVIEHLTTRNRLTSPRKMYLCLGTRQMDIFVFEHGHPLFINTYSIRNGHDCVYYALNVWKSLALNQQYDELYLMGLHHPDKDTICSGLRNFIKTVSLVNPVAEFNRSEMAEHGNIPYDLLALWHSGL